MDDLKSCLKWIFDVTVMFMFNTLMLFHSHYIFSDIITLLIKAYKSHFYADFKCISVFD